MKLRPKPSSACEPKWTRATGDAADQASALRRLAGVGGPDDGAVCVCPVARSAVQQAELVVLSPTDAGLASRVVEMLGPAWRGRSASGVAPGGWAEAALRRADLAVIALGCQPHELAAGFRLVRWIAGRRIDAPVGVLLVSHEECTPSAGVKRRFEAAIGAHIGRSGVAIGSLVSMRPTWRARRAVGRFVARLESGWHPDCGGVAL